MDFKNESFTIFLLHATKTEVFMSLTRIHILCELYISIGDGSLIFLNRISFLEINLFNFSLSIFTASFEIKTVMIVSIISVFNNIPRVLRQTR